MKQTLEQPFHAVEFFRNIKERMAKMTEGMTLAEERNVWQQMREGKLQLV